MGAKTETTKIDKTTWGDGPWQGEPDRVEWAAGEFHCLMRRVPTHGAWCGYVAVPPGHPWHGKDYGEIELEDDPHGGLTYAGPCDEICHKVEHASFPTDGEASEDGVWWLGFDCGHGFDVMPGYEWSRGERKHLMGLPIEYRDRAYVEAEVERLLAQARAAQP